MPILHNSKLIFIHIPKTGGQSIYHALGGNLHNPKPNKKILWGPDDKYEYSHFTAAEIKSNTSDDTFKNYYKFTMVRNPFDRLVSLYHHKKLGGDHRFVSAYKLTFSDFVKKLADNFHKISEYDQIDIAHVRPQHEYVYDQNEHKLVDHIFKFEHYDEIQAFIDAHGGVRLQKFNTTDHKPYQECYDEKTTELVTDIYQKDFKRFGYKKEP